MAKATILMVGGAVQVSVGIQYDFPNWVSEEVVSAPLEFGKNGKNRDTNIKGYVNLKSGDESM